MSAIYSFKKLHQVDCLHPCTLSPSHCSPVVLVLGPITLHCPSDSVRPQSIESSLLPSFSSCTCCLQIASLFPLPLDLLFVFVFAVHVKVNEHMLRFYFIEINESIGCLLKYLW